MLFVRINDRALVFCLSGSCLSQIGGQNSTNRTQMRLQALDIGGCVHLPKVKYPGAAVATHAAPTPA